jgi:hypothetical protein
MTRCITRSMTYGVGLGWRPYSPRCAVRSQIAGTRRAAGSAR